MRGTRQPHKSAPGIFAMFDILYVYNHTDPVVLVLYPGHVTYERSDVAFLLMDPDPEMPWVCVFTPSSNIATATVTAVTTLRSYL